MITIIPAIDIINGKCVRLTKGNYSTAKIYSSSPCDIAKEYEHLGLKELVVSEKIPNFVLVANMKTLDKNLVSNIKNELLNIRKEEVSKWHKSLKFGTKESNNKDYDHLRDVIKSTLIKFESNY